MKDGFRRRKADPRFWGALALEPWLGFCGLLRGLLPRRCAVCVVWLLAPEPLCFHSFSGCLPLRSVFLLFLFCCFLAMPPFISPGPYFLSCGIVFSHLRYFPNFCVCSRLWKLGFTLFFGVRSPVSALFSRVLQFSSFPRCIHCGSASCFHSQP